MIYTIKFNHYKAFGLTISSEIPLPELTPLENIVHLADVLIEKTDLNSIWLKYGNLLNFFVVRENFVLFKVPNLAIFLIKDGNKILVSPEENTDQDLLRLYLLGTCMGAVLLMKKNLPLHGSAIAIDGKAYAIVGDSGVGKSTLAKAFLNKGYQLLSDDVISITFNDEYNPIVNPSYPQQKLWLESLRYFQMEVNQYYPMAKREKKFIVPVPTQFSLDPLPLAGIFELSKTNNQIVEVNNLNKLERIEMLYRHTYRNFFIEKLGLLRWHFSNSASLVNKICFYQLMRPVTKFTADDLRERIVDTLKSNDLLKYRI